MPGFVLHVFLFFGGMSLSLSVSASVMASAVRERFFCLYVSLLGKHFVMIVRIIHYFCKINLLNAVSI